MYQFLFLGKVKKKTGEKLKNQGFCFALSRFIFIFAFKCII